MTAPTSSIATVAALTSLRTPPASFAIATSTPGLAGVLVLFRAPSTRPTPTALQVACSDAMDRALTAPTQAEHDAAKAFLASLPDVVSPVAALGLAVREACDAGHRWTHNRTADKASRWTYCAATVTADSVSILGAGTAAEAFADGRLVVDAGVPGSIAVRLRAAYDAARGVVEPSRIAALVATHLQRMGGRAITSDVYLLPEIGAATCGVLAGLVDLTGWAEAVAVADPAKIARLTSPVTRSIEQQIADVVTSTEAFIAKAAAAALPDGGTLQRRTGETVRAEIAAARAAVELWRDRLSLPVLNCEVLLENLDVAAVAADDAAQAAQTAKRDAAVAAKKATKA